MSENDLRREIAKCEEQLRWLHRTLRSKLGGLAVAGKRRTPRFPVPAVLEAYDIAARDGLPGAKERTATALGCSAKTVQRALTLRRKGQYA